MKNWPTRATLTLGICVTAVTPVFAAPLLDGSGFGAPSAVVAYDPTSPDSNFGAPTSTTAYAGYDIYTQQKSGYAYFLIAENGSGVASPGVFANLYFGTGATAMSGSDLGFEVTNSDVFSPGGSTTISTAGTGIAYATLNQGTEIEFAVPFTYFETDPQGIGFSPTTAANPDIILRLSQSFGYSVAGGTSYGPDRLGLVIDPIGGTPVPEPMSIALLSVGLIGIAAVRRPRA